MPQNSIDDKSALVMLHNQCWLTYADLSSIKPCGIHPRNDPENTEAVNHNGLMPSGMKPLPEPNAELGLPHLMASLNLNESSL